MASTSLTTPTTIIDFINSQSKNCFPFMLNIMIFVLYVMCFTGLYKPHLELIGFGLFSVLHTIMGVGMMKNMTGTQNMDFTKLNMFGFFNYISQIYKIVKNPFASFNKPDTPQNFTNLGNNAIISLFTIIYDIFALVFAAIIIILAIVLLIITIPFIGATYLGKFVGWNGTIPVSITIYIGLILLFVSFIILLISLQNVHTKHITTGQPALPVFLAGGYSVEKTGYTFKKMGPKGEGYYLNTGEGVDFFFGDKKTIKAKEDFKIIAITTTVLLWVQYFTNENYDMIKLWLSKLLPLEILGVTDKTTIENINTNILNAQSILYGISIVSLSCVCVWLTHKIESRTHSIQTPYTSK